MTEPKSGRSFDAIAERYTARPDDDPGSSPGMTDGRREASRTDSQARSINGRVVGRALRHSTRRLLEEQAFTEFTERKAWRATEYTIDHVTFRSYNACNAGVIGCTSYSFTVEVGVFYRCFEPTLQRPKDYNCTFRSILGKAIHQPFFATQSGPVKDRPEVYYELADGSNLDAVVTDATQVLLEQGLAFMDHFNDPARAFQSLLTERMTNVDFNKPGVMLPGNPGSPAWRDAALGIGHLVCDDPREAIRTAPVLGAK